MILIATVMTNVSPDTGSEIPVPMNIYMDGLLANDKKYFLVSVDAHSPQKSKIPITDDECRRLLKRMIT